MKEPFGYLNRREIACPLAIWMAMFALTCVGTFFFGFIVLGTYDTLNVGGFKSMSAEDWVNTMIFGISGLACFLSVFLAFRRKKSSRYLPIVSLFLVTCFVSFNLIRDLSKEGSAFVEFIYGLVGGLTIFILPLVFSSALLFLGRSGKVYFGVVSEDADFELPGPPSPPSF